MPPVPEKSLAVLPFDNFSEDKDSAFFADGVQDEILTDLSKVADLKVISRSWVMQYRKTDARNLREIGRTLGVAYVVEGSVQRAGNKVRVTAQLIDARTDTHQWAEEYVRDLSDVFAIQGEVARAIAGQLQAAISPRERTEMEDAPTHDEQAYQLYLRALARWNDKDAGSSPTGHAMETETMDLLRQATARDPGFVRAFVFMTRIYSILYYTLDPTSAAETAFRESAETVARLRPGSADADLAMGLYDYYGRRDYARAHNELTAVVRQSPNDARAFFYLGMIERHHARWKEAAAHLRRAVELDPEDNECFVFYDGLLFALGHFPEGLALIDRRIAAHPAQPWLHLHKAEMLLNFPGDARAARAELALLPPGMRLEGEPTNVRLACDCYDRDFAAATRDLTECPLDDIADAPRLAYEGDIARYRGDAAAAARAYNALLPSAEQDLRDHSRDVESHLQLAKLDVLLGRKEAALEEGRRALPLMPDDTLNTPHFMCDWARVLTLAGERDEAIRTLQSLCAKPFGPCYGCPRAEPDWDSLHGDPRFEAILASLAPK